MLTGETIVIPYCTLAIIAYPVVLLVSVVLLGYSSGVGIHRFLAGIK
jgi:hypothetical protein